MCCLLNCRVRPFQFIDTFIRVVSNAFSGVQLFTKLFKGDGRRNSIVERCALISDCSPGYSVA